MYISKIANDDTFNNEIVVNFTEKMIVSAILLDVYYSEGMFMGSPKKIVISSSIGSDEFKFDASYEGEAVYPWTRLLFELPVPVECDKIKFEYADVTESIRFINSPLIGNINFFQALLSETVKFDKASSGYENDTFLQSIIIDPSDFTYNGPDGLPDHDLSLAFDGDIQTCYISSEPNNLSFNNFVSIKFSKTVILEAFLYDAYYDGSILHGCPTGVFVFASLSNNDQYLVAAFFGSPVSSWSKIQFVFPSFVECDGLTIEFITVTSQSIVGNSNSPVINGIHIIRAQIPATPEPTNSSEPTNSPS